MGISLYELNRVFRECLESSIDLETGDVIDKDLFKFLDEIAEETEKKILNVGCYIKNLRAEETAYKAEIETLNRKKRAAANRAESLTSYLRSCIEPGQTAKDSRVSIGWRKSSTVLIDCRPEELSEDFQRVKIEADKSSIKESLKLGHFVKGATLEERQNIQIK